jgi:hypothetical protein
MKSFAVGLASVALALTMSACESTDAKPVVGVGALRARVQVSGAARVDDVKKVIVRITSSDPGDPAIAPLVLDTAAANGTYSGVFPNLRTTTATGPTYSLVAEATNAADEVLYRGTASNVIVSEGVPNTIHIVANSTEVVDPVERIPARITSVQANDMVRSGETLSFVVAYNSDATAPVAVSWEQVGIADPATVFSPADQASTTWTAPTTSVALLETITVSVSNGVGAASEYTFTVNVAAKIDVPVEITLNDPPTISGMTLSDSRINPGTDVEFAVAATDPNGDTLTYTFVPNSCSGALSQAGNVATFTADASDAVCRLKVTVSDPHGLSAVGLVTLVVDAAPPTRRFTMTPTLPYTLANVAGVADDGAPGFEGGSIRAAIGTATAKGELYFAPARLFGREITLGEIARMSYFTKKPTLHAGVPFGVHDGYLAIYTRPYAGQTTSWFGARVSAEPYYASPLLETAGEWNEWSTDGAERQLSFFESTYNQFGTYDDPTWSDFVHLGNSMAGPNGRLSLPYATLPVLYITLQTASNNLGFAGQLDGFQLELTDGTVAVVDFQE